MTVIDLSHPIHAQIPVYPGTEPPVITPATSIAADGFAELRISLFTHTATHIDAPCHILADGSSLDRYPAGHFIGRGLCLDLSGSKENFIDVEQLQPYRPRLTDGDYLLLRTGWSRYWGEPRYFENYPCLTPAAAGWLGQFSLRGVGIDAISVDPVDDNRLPAHRELLGRDILIIENLTNLQALPASAFTFCCLPLPLQDGDGSPVRAVALIGEGRCGGDHE